MFTPTKKTAAITAAVVLSLGGGAYAATSATAPTPLTGSITDKVSDAALAKVPGGTLVGVESESGGGYEAEVRKSDGTEVTVQLDAQYTVTGTRAGGDHGGGRGGHGGRGEDTAALAKALGVTEAKLQAAQDAVRPAQGDKGADRAAEIAKALGESTSDVQAVLDAQQGTAGANGFTRGGGRHGDDSALVAALAKKFSLTSAKVQTALQTAHQQKEADQAAALAKELGLYASKVQAALDAAHAGGRP